MNTTHTPGPWRVRDNGQTFIIEGAEESCPQGSARGFVASTGWHPMHGKDRVPTERTESNARLIAAAPDLLAALEDVMSDPYFAEASTRYVHARQAIAAARGA